MRAPVLLTHDDIEVDVSWDYQCELLPGASGPCCRNFSATVSCGGAPCDASATTEMTCDGALFAVPLADASALDLRLDVIDLDTGDHRAIDLGERPVRTLDAIVMPCRYETVEGTRAPCGSDPIPAGSAIELVTLGRAGDLDFDLDMEPTSNLGPPGGRIVESFAPGELAPESAFEGDAMTSTWWNVPSGPFAATVSRDGLSASASVTIQ